MEDPKGKELLKTLQDKEYQTFNKVLAGSQDYFRNLGTNKKELALRDLDYERHSLAVLFILQEYKTNDPISVINKFLLQFDPEQISYHFSRFCKLLTEFSDYLLENKVAVKLTKGLLVKELF